MDTYERPLRLDMNRPRRSHAPGEGETGEHHPLQRESSLLPGEVRTPSFMVTVSDWAAPGSSVWEDPVVAGPPSIQTPLTGYGPQSEVWGSATASPLTADHSGVVSFEAQVASHEYTRAVTVASATLQSLPPSDYLSQAMGHAPLPRAPERVLSLAHAEKRLPAASAGLAGRAPPGVPPSHALYPTAPSAFRMEEPAALESFPGDYDASPAHPPTSYNIPTSRFENKAVAQGIIASAGLPLSITSLLRYIHDGQPRLGVGTTATTTRRNFPNLIEPPMMGDPGAPGGAQPAHGVEGSSGMGPVYSVPMDTAGFSAHPSHGGRGGGLYPPDGSVPSEYRSREWSVQSRGRPTAGYPGVGGGPVPPALLEAKGPSAVSFFPDRSGGAHPDQGYGRGPTVGMSSLPDVHGAAHAHPGARPKTESEILSDLLHFHANFFPPPPPPRVPREERRARAELWYHYASKWDITHRLPPPPRTPLPEMEMEYRLHFRELTRVPYHGDAWLVMCDRWFSVMQKLFDYPEENTGVEVDIHVILRHAVLA